MDKIGQVSGRAARRGAEARPGGKGKKKTRRVLGPVGEDDGVGASDLLCEENPSQS